MRQTPLFGEMCCLIFCFGRRMRAGRARVFQSGLSVRGGTAKNRDIIMFKFVSIHPPRVGRDFCAPTSGLRPAGFNPPSPCMEGLQEATLSLLSVVFQSTLPHGEGHARRRRAFVVAVVSIHPPPAGRDDIRERVVMERLFVSIRPPRVGRDRPFPRILPQKEKIACWAAIDRCKA
jgi:hypothetical protein